MPTGPKRSTLLLWGYYLVLLVICLLQWVPLIQGGLTSFQSIGWDFVSLYAEASMLLHGQGQSAYDLQAQVSWQAALLYPRRVATGALSFLYPPTILPLLLPFALVPLSAGYFLWMAWSGALLGGSLLLLRRHLELDWYRSGTLLAASLSFWPLSLHLLQGQTSLIVLLGLTLGYLAWRRGREFWAGLALALCTIKPPLLLLFVLVLIGKRRWQALAGFVAGGLLLLLPSWPLIGFQGYRGYLQLLGESLGWRGLYGIFPELMQNWRAFALRLFGPGAASTVLWGTLTLVSLAALAWTWRGPWNPTGLRFPLQFATTIVLTTLVSPHLYMYDLVLWLLAGALVAFAAPQGLKPQWLRWALLSLGSLAPVLTAAMPGGGGPLTVAFAALAVACLLHWLRAPEPETATRLAAV